MASFYQQGPTLPASLAADGALDAYLKLRLPERLAGQWRGPLERLWARSRDEMAPLAAAAEANPPEHISYDPWGRRIDLIQVCPEWQKLEGIASEEGVIATAYERADGAWSRVHQFLRLYLYHPNSAIASCPMAMTDGAARVLQRHGDEDLKRWVLPRLLSRDSSRFWTAGQWMTERGGGSDVSRSETIAVPEGDEGYRLYGVKWFTSATTAQVAMTLARVEDDQGRDEKLSLFFVEVRDQAGQLRNIQVNRLKDKLGTRALPTAELTLEGTPARLVGERGRGVATIADILNITRLYNACCAAGYMGQGLALARDYAGKREAFGKPLIEHPLHRETLADLTVEHEVAFQLVFECARLLGREECGEASERELTCLRLLTPVTKLYTGKQVVAAISEVLEAFGGAGYVEDTRLPQLLRNAQVLPIWEGTTNVLSLDLLRAMQRNDGWTQLIDALDARLKAITTTAFSREREIIQAELNTLAHWPEQLQAVSSEALQANARKLAFRLAALVAAVLLLEQAELAGEGDMGDRYQAILNRWLRQRLGCSDHAAYPAGEAVRILDMGGVD
ncbi:alkylation response protein AidB-like acyl-CoA dehydrogenase [Natronospira proteinivora]|uniref:Alkylation response protein AidB-like acyl-CoA dehydrogenase n=1 Tax=Natronospira proteinivora TaxID=1807133 RepID=A0ABT1G4Q3_9GAMM|nr:acyl-CoA dehydrogenase family protein [Natronospira proteinivora]MCP1726276.1 alkylation response protein AidB-like acyl-CoA dehydrogenase [Natronospira proteinivora]